MILLTKLDIVHVKKMKVEVLQLERALRKFKTVYKFIPYAFRFFF